MNARFTPEQRFVVESVRRALGTADGPDSEAELSWSEVLPLATGQGLGPLVHAGTVNLELPMPAEIRARLGASYLGSLLRLEVSVEPVLAQALHALQAAGLEPMVLKGVALAYLVYPQPAQRTFSDIDLLVRHEQIDQASAALRSAGFWADEQASYPSHHLRPHFLGDSAIGVELHHHLLPQPSRYQLDLGALWERSVVARLGGSEARVLAPADALLHACIHLSYGHRYRWFPLRSLTDLLALTTSDERPIDWTTFVETVRVSRLAGAVYWPLLFSRRWLGAPVPPDVLASLAPPALLRRLTGVIAEPSYVLEPHPPTADESEILYETLLTLSLHSGCSGPQQVGALFRTFFPRPDGVAQCPAEAAESRLRYAAYLLRPKRIGRGAAVFRRVLKQLPHPTDPS